MCEQPLLGRTLENDPTAFESGYAKAIQDIKKIMRSRTDQLMTID